MCERSNNSCNNSIVISLYLHSFASRVNPSKFTMLLKRWFPLISLPYSIHLHAMNERKHLKFIWSDKICKTISVLTSKKLYSLSLDWCVRQINWNFTLWNTHTHKHTKIYMHLFRSGRCSCQFICKKYCDYKR